MITPTINVSDVVLGVEEVCRKPLRVLRAFQMAGIFNAELSEEALKTASDSIYDFRDLSHEEIWNEWKSWALYAKSPAKGLKLLEDSGWLEMFPLLFNMQGVPQNSKNHPEGDVWTHTKYVVDAASKVAERDEYPPKDRLALMFAALLHDVGKPDTTILNNAEWTAPKHDIHGAELSRTFLLSIGAPEDLIKKVEKLVRYHLAHILNVVTEEYVRDVSLKVLPARMDVLFGLMEADNSGRPPKPAGLGEEAKYMQTIYRNLNIEFVPLITPEIIIKLAKQNKIPSEYQYAHYPVADAYSFQVHQIVRHITEVQQEGYIHTAEEAVQYAIELLDDVLAESDRQRRVSDLAFNHDMEAKARLASVGLTEKEILTMPEEDLRRLLYPDSEE